MTPPGSSTGHVRTPRRPAGLRIPDQLWAQRLVFGAAGLFVGVACTVGTYAAGPGPWGPWGPWWHWATWSAVFDQWDFTRSWTVLQGVPFAALLLVVLLRRAGGVRWRWLSFAAGLALTPVLLFAGAPVAAGVRESVGQRSYSPAAWTAPGASASETRSWMVRSLIRDVGLMGRTVAEVDALLGPDDPSVGQDCETTGSGGRARWARTWRLGREPGRPGILRIQARDGKVWVVEIHTCGDSCDVSDLIW